jgi:DNA-binding GntR family transcriptional regulator
MTTLFDQALVLRILNPGGQLTDRQITAQTAVPLHRTRRALRTLHGNGLLRQVSYRQAWELSPCGRAYVTTPTGRAMLDVPRSALAE